MGYTASVCERLRKVGLDDAERVESAGNLRAVVDRAERPGRAADRLLLAHCLGRDRTAFDEARHEAALGLDEREHLGADAERRCDERGAVLGLPVDAEELGV